MKLQNKLLTLAMLLFIAVCSVTPITSYARQERSEKAKDSFKYSHPCPSNGNNHGACPGYVIDHITALACGGANDQSNMQWRKARLRTNGSVKVVRRVILEAALVQQAMRTIPEKGADALPIQQAGERNMWLILIVGIE